MTKTLFQIDKILLAMTVALVLPACKAPASSRTAASLTAGERVAMALDVGPAGAVSATGISSESEEIDCEDGIDTATGAECDGGPAANQDDGTETETPETFAQQAGTGAESELEVITFGTTGDLVGALGLSVEGLAPASSTRMAGQYLGGHVFRADASTATPALRSRVVARLEAVRVLPDGKVGLTVLGHEVVADADATVATVSSAEEAADGDAETDGVDCQQEGEHEGNNEGC